MKIYIFISLAWVLLAVPLQAMATFADVPVGHPIYSALRYLHAEGVVTGYNDGTFRVDTMLNRAEALKFIVSPLLDNASDASVTEYTDVQPEDWFAPYVAWAVEHGVIDSPQVSPLFNPAKPVTKAEFVKMLLLTYGIDPRSYNEIQLPLSSDVTESDIWYYPYMRFAVASGIVRVNQAGALEPGQELRRGDIALFMYRFLAIWKQADANQLHAVAKKEMEQTLQLLEVGFVDLARAASARSLLLARGLHTALPNDMHSKAVVRTAEAIRSLVESAYSFTISDDDQVILLAGEAWRLAAEARDIHQAQTVLANAIQFKATNLADEAREQHDVEG